jgi:hypothetical protein
MKEDSATVSNAGLLVQASSEASAPAQGSDSVWACDPESTSGIGQNRGAIGDEDEEVQGGDGGQTCHMNPDEPSGKSTELVASQEPAQVRS